MIRAEHVLSCHANSYKPWGQSISSAEINELRCLDFAQDHTHIVLPPTSRTASPIKAPSLVAHRGNAGEFPENTLPALRSALELGIPFVEFDVQLSADHVPIVLHDANLQRCAGVDRDALSLSWRELQTVHVGEATRFGERFNHVRIPALSQAVHLLQEFPHATAFVEIKRASLRQFGADTVLKAVTQAIRPIAHQAVLISFDLPALCLARQLLRMPIGWVLPEYSTQMAIKAEATLPDYLFCNWDKLPSSRLWRGPWQWAIYEITTDEQISSLLQRGVHLLETMQVRRMSQQLALMLATAVPLTTSNRTMD